MDDRLLRALSDLGYETPSPIQAETIPTLLDGRDLVGLAQTGTGKTAAFALPILQNLDLRRTAPQALVLAPTRELVIQVAEAFQRYAINLPGFHVLPIYGGQSYGPQLHGLRRGAHVVVGTPGRLIDHLGKRSLDLSALRTLILDEADEMLRMGFIEDIQAILTSVPEDRQTALFSATMPPAIRKISRDYLRNPAEITVKNKTTTAALTRQRYWPVSGLHKLDALTRILEVEPFTAMIVFVRTKQATEDLATKLRARGFDAAAINGDIPQPQRERTIGQLRDGTLDILVATDVAARGLDVERISHVLNYDIPHDAEAYVHRIGRTGRAGRSGEAILFVAPRERHLVRAIEKATRQTITPMELPSVQDVNEQRIARFSQSITDALASEDLGTFQDLVEDYEQTHNVPALEIAAALARIVQGDRPLLLETGRPAAAATPTGPPALFQVSVGRAHRVRPGALVGALANEGGLDSRQIGRIDIRADHSLVELPADLPAETLDRLQQTKVAGHALRIRRADADAEARSPRPERTSPGNKKKPRHKKSAAPAGSSYSRPGRRHG
ncbi:MAG TPA: DEAD/DEAH box helicase [Mycobacteriales bacterium]|nr:DEAD/DEAH box helicase [Mycobacteriales bacterium]